MPPVNLSEAAMLLEILKRTPIWVFVLFAVLLSYGLVQMRTRRLGRIRVVLLPVIMMSLSIFGVAGAFGFNALPFMSWFAGVGLAVAARIRHRPRWQATHEAATDSFIVPGSWIPLALMMAIFLARYVITVSLALDPALARSSLLIGGASLLYGAMSGVFLSRALHILASATPREVRPAEAAS
jgi:hypothetical protein